MSFQPFFRRYAEETLYREGHEDHKEKQRTPSPPGHQNTRKREYFLLPVASSLFIRIFPISPSPLHPGFVVVINLFCHYRFLLLGGFDHLLESVSSRKCLIRSLFPVRLENCFSQTSLKRAKTLRPIVSWSSKIASVLKGIFHFSN